jgi:hypothetical protein
MDDFLRIAALLVTAWLFGGMLLFAAAFAAFLFKVLPAVEARALIRKAFPAFYVFVMGTSALAALLSAFVEGFSALILALIALTTLPTRQILMPAINRATDQGERKRFMQLHGLSVVITLAHIVAAAFVLVFLMG